MDTWNASRNNTTLTTLQHNNNNNNNLSSKSTNNNNNFREASNNTNNTIRLSNYEFAYHHQIQTAIQMGQFYNPSEHHHNHHTINPSSLLRTSSSSISATNSALLNVVGATSINNCLGGIVGGGNTIWDNPLLSNVQRNANISYHHGHGQTQSNELQSITNPILPSSELWTTTPSNTATGPVVNGRGSQRTGQHKSSTKKPRRRVATMAQRRAANIRERRRMFNLNEAFDKLRRKVPTFAYEKRLSRIETLRLAITYISFMDDILSVPADVRGISNSGKSQSIERKSNSSSNNNTNNNYSNHHSHHNNILQNNSQYSLLNSRGNVVNNGSGNGSLVVGVGIDSHQNQNVPPISPFTPIGRMYSHHPSSVAYLNSNIHH